MHQHECGILETRTFSGRLSYDLSRDACVASFVLAIAKNSLSWSTEKRTLVASIPDCSRILSFWYYFRGAFLRVHGVALMNK